ncbi:MAG: diheme cytochrome c [Chroococcidiopsidaceae cyanobacterium CP_BM_ER_R8_30]|nr:diheme cytochrome c [Chroococcidiopsidaceae cyanobacterium CP_BM_ER_R8_30]
MSYLARQKPRQFPVLVFLAILLWSLATGWGLALMANAQPTTKVSISDAIGTVDPVTPRYKLGEETYLENCASCHIAVPPAVLPTQTWQHLLQDPQHYGVSLSPLGDPSLLLVWNYLRAYSRPQEQAADEQTPYRVNDSRYFRALHPRVKLPRPIRMSSCVSCHPGAAQYNFRRLTAEWQNAP